MSPRKRSEKNRGFPDNLYENNGYFSYKNPETGQHFGIGRDKREAFSEAIKANLHLAGKTQKPSLVERLTGDESRTWGKWCGKFEELLAERGGSNNTKKAHKKYLKRARKSFDENATAAKITTLQISEKLEAIKKEGKFRTAQAFRSFLIDSFDRMKAQGWLVGDNPANLTDEIGAPVKRARLQFDVFMRVYEAETLVWAKNCYALALVSGQDRESCGEGMFKDVRDGAWWNERGKTGVKISIPTDLKMECFGMSLEDVIRQCRSTGVLSPYMIHQTEYRVNSAPGDPISLNTISKRFTETLDTLRMDWGDQTAPTFHEIRSLAERIYKRQGNVNTKELLGHKHQKTTDIYDDERGAWIRVQVRKAV